MKYDFCGWATKNDLECADGLIIRKDAFKENDGKQVSLFWNHQHDSPENIIGHAILENRDEGVFAYGYLNDTELGKTSKTLIEHGDIISMSIHANQIKKQGPNITHGNILEVSLVYAAANPGAAIVPIISHGIESEDEVIIYSGEDFYFSHSDDNNDNNDDNKGETVRDVINTMNEKQKNVLYALLGGALEGDFDEEKGGDDSMKHNVFDNEDTRENTLTHADEVAIIKLAKKSNVGSLQDAINIYAEANKDTITHAIENIGTLFPEYHDVRPGAPEMLTTDQGWITKVLNKVHKTPFARIRTRQVDVRNIEQLRAQGYKTKGSKKKEVGNIKAAYRTTDPMTVYVKSKLDKDDITDVEDFNYVSYMYQIDRMNLNEELATAIMFGDGREDGDEGKIDPTKIRNILNDDDLYTIHAEVDIDKMEKELQGSGTSVSFGENYIYAEAIIQALLYAREKYKGSGNPDFYCTPHLVNVMLLARDMNGRRIYSDVGELTRALNVNEIITVEQMEGKERTDKEQKKHEVLGIMYNFADYHLGANKNGQITHYTDFDIDFNQEKSLLETRCSGANTRLFSAIVLEKPAAGE